MRTTKTACILLLLLVLLPACSSEESNKNDKSASSLKIVNNMKEAGPGPLTPENTSLAEVHIGDTQEQVTQSLGEPDQKIDGGGGTPNIRWLYEADNLAISFYRSGETMPVGGVVDILISGPSSRKTDKNVGIGSSEKDIIIAYPEVSRSEKTTVGVVNYWVNGTKLDEEYYHPSLIFVVKGDKVTTMELTNSLIDPGK